MFKVLLPVIFAVTAAKMLNDPASNQLINFKKSVGRSIGRLTYNNGAPVDYETATSSLNKELITNEQFMEMMEHFDREVIPERVAHAQGTGAFGYFEVINDVTHITKADFLSAVGKKTPVGCRFSTTASSRGASEFARETRGFACKFYTKEGNYDFVGLDGETFSAKDPLLTATLVHMAKRNPVTNLPDLNMFWDLASFHPEALYRTIYAGSDMGMPDGYRHMKGHNIHTMQFYNENGTSTYCRIHFLPSLGLKTLNASEIARISAADPNYFTRDLYNSIANGEYPSWEMYLQCLSEDEVKKTDLDVFSVVNILPRKRYPYKLVGKLTLNKNPNNYFADVEQMAFCPGNLVPGILPSPDKIMAGRIFAYRDTQNRRLGENFDKIKVNCPLYIPAHTYQRDGKAPVGDNGGSAPWYSPNSFFGPEAEVEKNRPKPIQIHEKPADNFKQCNELFLSFSEEQQNLIITNIIKSLCNAENYIQDKIVKHLKKINSKLGKNVAAGLLANNCKMY